MAIETASGLVKGLREAVGDVLAPDIREIKADVRTIRERLDAIDKGFDRPKDQLSTCRDVQMLKEQMAELPARQQPSA
jgi:hypothetical protein